MATRLSILRAELRQVEATREYLNGLFVSTKEKPHALILEADYDAQTLARDIRVAEIRYEYAAVIF